VSQSQVVREFMDDFGEAGIDDSPNTTRFTVFQRADLLDLDQPQEQASEQELEAELRAEEARVHARVASIGRRLETAWQRVENGMRQPRAIHVPPPPNPPPNPPGFLGLQRHLGHATPFTAFPTGAMWDNFFPSDSPLEVEDHESMQQRYPAIFQVSLAAPLPLVPCER